MNAQLERSAAGSVREPFGGDSAYRPLRTRRGAERAHVVWRNGKSDGLPSPALHGFYCRWDNPQQQYQKALLRSQRQAALSGELGEVLALDDPPNDEVSRAPKLVNGFLK